MVLGVTAVLETQLSSLERLVSIRPCAKYRPMIRLMYDASDEEKARVEQVRARCPNPHRLEGSQGP